MEEGFGPFYIKHNPSGKWIGINNDDLL